MQAGATTDSRPYPTVRSDGPLARTIRGAAERLGVSTTTVWRMIGRKELETVKFGRRTNVTERSIQAAFEKAQSK